MIDRWQERNIDLNTLSDGIKQFFTERQFETKLETTKQGQQIEASTHEILNTKLTIIVDVKGKPNDFTIKFDADPRRKGFFTPSMIVSYISTALGGGAVLRSELKLRESLDKLEKTFWTHVDQLVENLTNTATE